jgi:hypothetical protein
MNHSNFEKIIFRLTQDEDGYPPVGYESLWGIGLGNDRFQIDNIPLYINGVSKCDVVEAKWIDGELRATKKVKSGGHSTLNVFVEDATYSLEVQNQLASLGAVVMKPQFGSLFSIDVSDETDLSKIEQFLVSISDDELVAYGDLDLQHNTVDASRKLACFSAATIPFDKDRSE